MPAIKFQKLGVDKDNAWDAGENVKRLKEDQPKSYYEKMFAWETDAAAGNKSDYKFAHHFVSESGEIGKASLKACATAIASLNGGRNKPDIPEGDFKDVYEHFKGHYQEAGLTGKDIPELKCEDMPNDDPMDDDPEDNKRFQKGKLEYRAMEVRASLIGGTEDQPQEKILEGRPIVFDTPTPIFQDYDGTIYYEQIHHDALNGVDLSNVVLKYNHSEHVPPLASTKGHGLTLTVDSNGMGMMAKMANTTQANDIHELVRTGNLDKMSFAFTVANDAYDSKTKTRTIFQFDKIYDVSVVDFPAYEQTSVSARNYIQTQQEARRKELQTQEQKSREQKTLDEQRKKLLLKSLL